MTLFWQYVLIFLGVAIEGPGVTLTAAALAGGGHLDPYLVFLCAAAGNLSGDFCWYLIGYYGHFDTLAQRFPRFARYTLPINRLKSTVSERAERILFTAKLAFGVASIPALVAAGVARVPLKRVAPVQILGEVIWTGGLVLFGYLFGQYVARLEKDLQIAALITGVVIAFVVIEVVRRQIKVDLYRDQEQREHPL
ncbi:MAG TPA: VTT domain-containing protein [Caldilineaceae bacterium]|nr:VTT domain-containing protein [Caldilineaceae bacterium]